MPHPTRRSVLLGAAAFGFAGSASAQTGPTVFRDVAVDVTPLRAQGLGAFADLLGQALYAETRAAFADRLGGGGPTLVVRITGLSLRPYVGGGGGGGRASRDGGGDNDYLEGEALVVGPRGAVLARYPQLYAQTSSYGGAWYLEGGEQRRAVYLARNYALWLRRRVA